ncbi:hypothetical protein BH10CHL1_BH10CHL1_22870 [soil metagenome]
MAGHEQIEHCEITEEIDIADINRDTGDDTDSTPRWVKIFGIIFIGLVVLVVIMHLTGHSFGGHTLR